MGYEFAPGDYAMSGMEVVEAHETYLLVKLFDYQTGKFSEPRRVPRKWCYPYSEFNNNQDDKQLHELTEWLKSE